LLLQAFDIRSVIETREVRESGAVCMARCRHEL